MRAHLAGREKALEPLGWTGRQARWIAFVCRSGGVFTRAQLAAGLGVSRRQALALLRPMSEQGLLAHETVEGVEFCRILQSRIYRAVDAWDMFCGPEVSAGALMQRLLSLDYVIEHPRLPWLLTEPEKVAAFEGLSIERELLPSRRYAGVGRDTRRYFPRRLPVALEDGRALFVWADPGYAYGRALRTWFGQRTGLWRALAERGRCVEVAAVGRTPRDLLRARITLQARTRAAAGNPSGGPGETGREIARIERAVLEGDGPSLAEYGGLKGAIERLGRLRRLRGPASERHPRVIDAFTTWRSSRLAGGWS